MRLVSGFERNCRLRSAVDAKLATPLVTFSTAFVTWYPVDIKKFIDPAQENKSLGEIIKSPLRHLREDPRVFRLRLSQQPTWPTFRTLDKTKITARKRKTEQFLIVFQRKCCPTIFWLEFCISVGR